MEINFQIEYRTTWGENVRLNLQYTATDGQVRHLWKDLSTSDGAIWRTDLTLPSVAERAVYTYSIVKDGAVVRNEWVIVPHKLKFPAGMRRMVCHDRWHDMPHDAHCFTSAFTEAFLRRELSDLPEPRGERMLVVRVFVHALPEGCELAVSGNQPLLGNWEVGRELRMREISPNEWAFAVDVSSLRGTIEYKYLALDRLTGERRGWEMRDNRRLVQLRIAPGMMWVIQDESVTLPFSPWRGAGCVIPVFSIRSEGSFGVGDFGDIKRMVDWLVLTGQHVLQILPINDTTITGKWSDSYPYNSTSVYAFHPMYVDFRALPRLKDLKKREHFETVRKELNALGQMDYEEVNKAKREYLRLLFEQEGERTLARKGYRDFYRRNEEWLLPYAAFCYLRETHESPDFHDWGDWSVYNAGKVSGLCQEGTESLREIRFHCFVQYLLHVQLLDASRYARSRGVALKADIPIGVCRTGVDVWTEPGYFNMSGQAGAPPDAFSPNGQNWGFPTYNWDRMMADGCQWWRRRLGKMAEYFDAFRIDHVLGFFRIWEIPRHSVHGLLGQFSPAMPMTAQEVESYGLPWRDQYTRPLITDWILYAIFGDRAAEVRRLYLDFQGDGHYCLKPEYATQRQVEKAFAHSHDDALRDGLYRLISNVLFVVDNHDASAYHPRIAAQGDYAYRALGDWEKEAFNKLYEEYFYHRHNKFWYNEAMRKLSLLVGSTRMLPCAEDLGMVPACVPWALDALRILSLEIQSMPKNPQYSFAHLWENPYRSVATISTHDMPTLRGWWEEDKVVTQRFYKEALCHDGPAPSPLPGWLAQQVVSLHLDSPSMLCLLSLQDWLSVDEKLRYPNVHAERINIPARPRHYWRYRMHLTTEQLMSATELNDKIRRLIKTYGR